jgi:hypothetical protein
MKKGLTSLYTQIGKTFNTKNAISLSMDFMSQEHGVPRDGPKDSNAGG